MYFVQNYIKDNGIRVLKTYMEKTRWVALERNSRMNIVLSDNMDEVQEREVLSHEVWHIIDWTVDTHICFLWEKRANKIWRSVMIPYDKLKSAIEEIWECDLTILAKVFWCSYEFMERRMHDLFPNTI